MTERPTLEGMLSLEDRVSVVTGAGGGIGSAVCRVLLAAGSRVAGVDRPGASIVEGVQPFKCDVSERGAVTGLFAELRRHYDRIDSLVHCAGITRDGVLWKMEPERWSEVLRVNLDSAFFVLKEAVPMLRRGCCGTVVLISSINGERGKFGQTNYAASKAGLIGLGRSAARELGRFGIRVNVVSPGLIESPMTASLPPEIKLEAVDETVLGHAGQPEDVANAVYFLCTRLSRHVTGQVLRVDGGQLMA